MIDLRQGDCLEVMKDIPDNSIDMILCDLPYGVLNKSNINAKWDIVISFDKLWEQYNRIIKDNGAIVLFSSGMFTADLMTSNKKMWRYNLIWKKGNRVSGFLNANRQPLRNHEDICIFSKKQTTYNPQMVKSRPHNRGGGKKNNVYGYSTPLDSFIVEEKYPNSIINVDKDTKHLHPTQKPVTLLEYLIKTYTNENDTVLDNCMGSGSSGVACLNTNRNFIGIELDETYFNIAKERIEKEV